MYNTSDSPHTYTYTYAVLPSTRVTEGSSCLSDPTPRSVMPQGTILEKYLHHHIIYYKQRIQQHVGIGEDSVTYLISGSTLSERPCIVTHRLNLIPIAATLRKSFLTHTPVNPSTREAGIL